MTLMTQSAFATHCGVGKSAVSNWKKAGLLVFADEGAGPLVHVERSEARLNAKIDRFRGRPTTAMNAAEPAAEALAPAVAESGQESGGFAAVRVQVAAEDLIAKRLKNARDASELVPRLAAERQCAELGRAVRERVQAWLRGAADRLAIERDPRVVVSFASEELDQVFADLADQVAAGALEDAVADAIDGVDDGEAAVAA